MVYFFLSIYQISPTPKYRGVDLHVFVVTTAIFVPVKR